MPEIFTRLPAASLLEFQRSTQAVYQHAGHHFYGCLGLCFVCHDPLLLLSEAGWQSGSIFLLGSIGIASPKFALFLSYPCAVVARASPDTNQADSYV